MTIIDKVLEWITGKDDLERVAARENLAQLNAYLKTRRIWIPKRPNRFIDAESMSEGELLAMIEKDAHELDNGPFEPWILEVDGKKRLPAFSSQKKTEVFSGKISKQLNKLFSLGCAEVLLEDVTTSLAIDFVDLNALCEKSWEISVKKGSAS